MGNSLNTGIQHFLVWFCDKGSSSHSTNNFLQVTLLFQAKIDSWSGAIFVLEHCNYTNPSCHSSLKETACFSFAMAVSQP